MPKNKIENTESENIKKQKLETNKNTITKQMILKNQRHQNLLKWTITKQWKL